MHEQTSVVGGVVVVDFKLKVTGDNHSLPPYTLDDGVGSEVFASCIYHLVGEAYKEFPNLWVLLVKLPPFFFMLMAHT